MIKMNKELINGFLKFRRWHKTDLAKAMNFSDAYITRIFNGERPPSHAFMEKLAKVTNLPPEELFFCPDTYKKSGNIKNSLKCIRKHEVSLIGRCAPVGVVRSSEGPFRPKKRHS
jgi:transcriptional regulator with XRE-family HTH domain